LFFANFSLVLHGNVRHNINMETGDGFRNR